MEQAEKSAAKTKAKGDGTLRLINESGVVQPQFADRGFEVFEIAGVDWINSTEHHWVNFLKTRERVLRRISLIGNCVADLDLCRAFDCRYVLAYVAVLDIV